MSQRGKRQPNRTDDGPIPAKRRKCRPPPAAEEEETTTMDAAAAAGAVWTPRPLNDLKISSIYNRSASEAPAELFRKDLISAMKLPDSEPLSPDEYWIITDQWKQEWERGVQVPVNPDSLPEPTVTLSHNTISRPHHEFKLPKSKYIRITKDEFFTNEEHFLSNTPTKAEKACSYDLDDCDIAWLQIINGERACMGLHPISEDQLERVIEELEIRCWEKVQTIVKTEEGLGIEYDENVICDVCRSPDSEEGNEMVFCDSCNICVHQACYGITTIPSGSWLCRTCALSLRPECVLCPNKGGAMKCTRSGQKWAHVSCALWIPEVSIGCVERMEPITKISSIPQSRWALICVLCRERVGACIQCSVKTCKTAYHVTCAFKHGLEMKAIIEDENADDGVKLRSYCQKHSVTSKKDKSGSASEDEESKRKKRKDMTSEEKNQARAAKLQEIEAEFDKHVSVKDITQHMDVDTEGIQFIYNYWKLKRKAGFNKPLLPPKSEDVDILSRQQEQADLEKMKMFVQLRQDLERVRNLCYMVSRREKLSRTFFRMREQTFHKQAAVLSDASCSLKGKEVAAVIEANHGPSIYDRLYSQPGAEDHSGDFDVVLARIAGIASPRPSTADEKTKTDLNGLVKCSDKKENPYDRLCFNGASRHRSSLYGSMTSDSETDRRPKNPRIGSADSSTEEEEKPGKRPLVNRKSGSKTIERKRSKKSLVSKSKVESSSEEEDKPSNKSSWHSPRSRTLRQMEREMGDKASASDDSDELLIPVKSGKNEPHKMNTNTIYSDSDSEGSADRNESKSPSNTPSDSQQHVLRTKAAMKEFSAGLQSKVDKSPQKNNTKPSKAVRKEKEKEKEKEIKHEDSMDDDFIKDKENVKSSRKKEYDPTDLIVPQRQAAKKATESIRCSQGRPKEQIPFEQEALKTPPSVEEPKAKPQSQVQPPQQKLKHKTKDAKTSKDGKSSADIYDFEKESSDAQEILAYVPQRQAAKKAAAHIKSGMTKPGLVESEVKKEATDSKGKKESEIPKGKKEQEQEKPKGISKPVDSKAKTSVKILSSSSSSSSSDDSSSTSSESEDAVEEKSKPPPQKVQKKDKKASIEALFSSDGCDKKSKCSPDKKKAEWPFPQHTSSSSDTDSDSYIKKSRTKSLGSEEKSKPKVAESEDRKGSNSKLVGKKFKKAPDKKLKTSDGRPELEFQPPIVERDESSRTKGRGRKHGPGEEDRLRNAESRPGDISSAKSGDNSPSGKRSRTPQKDQHEARKRKSSDVDGGLRSDVETPPRKERVRSIEHIPPAAKKTEKKIEAEKESLGSQLEREISERKAERETPGKKTSKVTLDRLFEKRDKKIDRLFGSGSPEKPAEKDTKKDVVLKEVDKKLSVKQDIQTKDKQKPLESPVKVEESSSKKPTTKDKPGSENEDARRNKNKEIVLPVESTQLTSIDKETVIKKVEKPVESSSQSEKEDASRRISVESGNGDEDNSKKKTKPMPKCKKEALRILDGGESNVQEIEDVKIEAVKEIRPSEEPIKQDQDSIPIKLPEPEELPSETALKELAAPVLSPEHEQATVVLAENKTATQGSFTLMPQLEKVCGLVLGNEFQVPEQEPLEAKKITSRSSSLSVPNYPQRSIFSPQQPSKDPPVSELFDFENDILAVDETVNDDGFSIARDSEEIMRAPPLTFSFSSEFLFKEDSKEDSARETHLLVEKLRLEYAKKTNVIQPETSETIAFVQEEPSIRLEDITEEKPEELPPCQQVVDSVEPSACEVKEDKPDICNEVKPDIPVNIECSVENKLQQPPEEQLDKSEVPPYVGGDANGPYDYHACSMQLEVPKVSIPGREKLDRSNSAQADERWVPPSVEFMPEQHHGLMPTHHYESLPPAPSPYTDLRNRTKWTESEMIPARRSSSSSASSTSSSSHREEPDPNKRDDLHLPPHNPSGADIASYQGLHPGIPPYITDAPPYHTYSEASPFVGSVALFPPPSCAQMQYPSPGGLYPPFGPPFPTPLLAPVPKPPEDPQHMPPPCAAAFTSSSHNMALTTAIVSPSPSVGTPNLMAPAPSPVMQHSDTPSFVQPQEPIQQLSLPMSPIANHHQSSPVMPPTQTPPTPSPAPQTPQTPAPPPPPPPPPPTLASLSEPHTPKPTSNATAAGKKIPTKPTRTSARFISQQGKSPGKSPRQQDTSSGKTTTQNRMRDASGNKRVSRAMYNQPRGGSRRGRGRGRGQHVQHFPDSDFNTIHSKLVGTVYDLEFDDDSPSESVENLRAMRERRRSTDMHERKNSDTPFLSRDSPPPHPMPNSKLRSSYNDLRPPSPLPDEMLHPPSNDNRLEQFPDVVQPLLPGPVDMRTYSSSYEPAPTNNPTAYHNHLLGTFATAAAEQHVTDFVEDLEKELHSALQASKAPATHSFTEEIAKTVDEQPVAQALGEIVTSNNKVSLSDSRNQLKVKIKGPFLDANYAATSSMQPQQQQPAMPPLDVVAVSNIIPAATTAISSAASSSGTSNLRRMRKKELLRQYCSQDMNMDDPAAGAVTGQATAPAAIPPVNRNVITIPKAVASMTTIPTREDYKAVVDANMEKKRRKEKAFASSLRHFDLPGDADDVGPPERRRSVGSTGSNASQPDTMTTPPIKRRGRPPKSTIPASGPIMVLAPKLKIKIGNSIIGAPETDTNLEEKRLRVRPPKKRLTSVQKPTVEELKRESMKFRRMIMADFDEAEKKQNKLVTGKRRKQRQSSDLQHQVQIITANENVSAPKLIIRLNKRSANNDEPVAAPVVDSEVVPVPVASAEGSEGSERTSKVTPIRLKLARCQEGYVMKTSQEGGAPETVLPQSEGCEVR